MSESEPHLDSILKKTQDKAGPSLLPDELSYLLTAFLPTQSAAHRSKAYLVLSAFCQGVRASTPPKDTHSDSATETLEKAFASSLVSRLGDVEEVAVLAGISFLAALFRVDQESASSIFTRDGIPDVVADTVDLFPSETLALEVGHLLGQASGHKSCRAVISPQSHQWLEAKSCQTNDLLLRAATTVALVKLSRGRASDNPNDSSSNNRARDSGYSKLLKGIVIEGKDQSSLTDAVEGLAYLSVDPSVKEDLSRDTTFLSRLFSIAPRRTRASADVPSAINSTLLYGIIVVISNICVYRPRLSEEHAQIEKMKRMAQAKRQTSSETDESTLIKLEDDDHCRERARCLVASGVIDVLSSAVSVSDSRGVRLSAGKAFLSIIEDKENRGKVLQGGGAKALRQIIGQLLTSPSPSPTSQPNSLDVEELAPIQALAKLAITSSPLQVFGPNQGAIFDAIRPLTLMLLHPSSNLLQRFEALMALTNLSSEGPETAARIAKVDNLMNKVELLLLEDHTLVRRAAMELVCNLIAGSDEVFERYCGAGRTSSSKLLVVLALCDVEDLPTRLAASGALATLTTAPAACHALLDFQRERHRVFAIFTQLIDPSSALQPEETEEAPAETHPGLIHRGVVCARNFLLSIQDTEVRKVMSAEAKEAGLAAALATIARADSTDEGVLNPTTEALGWFAVSIKAQ
jgi:hypothetical protein